MGSWSARSETLSSNKKRVIQELVNGKDCATQLQILFNNSSEKTGPLSPHELVHNIFTSFDHSLSLLTNVESAEVSRNQTTKEKRGCYKRRKSEQTWTVVSATVEDGHAWRKYGQKQILSSKNPRGYFRCSRKYDQGCMATKQVQRTDDGSGQTYRITYIGTHTCRPDSAKATQITRDSESWEPDNILSKKLHDPHCNPSHTANKEETTTATTSGADLGSVIMWKDIIGSDYWDSSVLCSDNHHGNLFLWNVEMCFPS